MDHLHPHRCQESLQGSLVCALASMAYPRGSSNCTLCQTGSQRSSQGIALGGRHPYNPAQSPCGKHYLISFHRVVQTKPALHLLLRKPSQLGNKSCVVYLRRRLTSEKRTEKRQSLKIEPLKPTYTSQAIFLGQGLKGRVCVNAIEY